MAEVTTLSGPTGVKLFKPTAAGVYRLEELYRPNVLGSTGTIIAPVGSLISDKASNYAAYFVTAIDPITFAPTLASVRVLLTSEEQASATSVQSYGNDRFYLHIDRSITPHPIRVDSHLFATGSDNAYYRIIRYPNTPNEVVVSAYYDADGRFTGNTIPMQRLADNANYWSFTNGHASAGLQDGEHVRLEIFNIYGMRVFTAIADVTTSVLLNELRSTPPVLSEIRLTGNQMITGGDYYIYEKQDIASLNIGAELVYDDGRIVTAEIDSERCFINGLEDFVASFTGLQQKFVIRYFLAQDEMANVVVSKGGRHLAVEGTVTVIPNTLAAGVKLSLAPYWNAAVHQYSWSAFAYNTDRAISLNVTPHVTIDPPFRGTAYGESQVLTLSVDLQAVDPTAYNQPTTHTQTVVVKLQQMAADVRFTIRDALSSPTVYGADTPTQRRPVIFYDSARQQYYIPSSRFSSDDAFMGAFYRNANPPYDARMENQAPIPTHFLLRDIVGGSMLIATPIAVEARTLAFSLLPGGSADRLVDGQVFVEFIKINGSTRHILYGVPVDVLRGTSAYVGP